nr:hypothetical protein [Tanacetum cinerariifolium]
MVKVRKTSVKICKTRFDESFYEAWDRFNDLLRACPHHGFSELHQLDTFYNALNVNDQDSLNSAAGGNFLDKIPRECLKIIESKSKVRQSRAKAVVAKVSTSSSTPATSSEVDELKDMVRALLLDKKNQSSTQSPTPAPVKAVEPNCVTCGGAHSYQNCPATSGNVYRDNIQEYVSQAATANYNQGNTGFRPQMVANQIRPAGFSPVQTHQNNQNNFNRGNNFIQNRGGNFNQSNFNQGQLHRPQVNQPSAYHAPAYQAPIPQTQRVSQTDFESYVKANDAILKNIQSQGQNTQNQCQNMQNQYQNLKIQTANLTDMLFKFVSSNTASSSGSGTLLSNTITNLKEELKEFNKDIDWDAVMDHVNQKSKKPQYIKRYQGMKKRPQTESEARKNMMIYLKNTAGYKMDFFKGMTHAEICLIFQARFDENMRFLLKSREEMEEEDQEIIKSINETPAQKSAKIRKLSEEAQEAKDLRKRLKIVLVDNKPRFKIIKADETHQFCISFTTLLKNFNREDLENLWGIVKERFSTSKPTNFSDEYLLLTLKTMFEKPDEQDAIWRNQKSVHGLALLFLLVERRYPLSRFTLEQLVNVTRLQVKEESEMSLELLRFTRQQLQEYQQG